MITLRPGSPLYRLLLLLAAGGEFPTRALHLVGNKRSLVDMIYKLESIHQFRTESGDLLGTFKLFSANGRREMRTLRLYNHK